MSSRRLPIYPEDVYRLVCEDGRPDTQIPPNHSFLGPVMSPHSIQGHSSRPETPSTGLTTYAVATGFSKQHYEPYLDNSMVMSPYDYHRQQVTSASTMNTTTTRPLLSLAPIQHPSSPSSPSLVSATTMNLAEPASAPPLSTGGHPSIDADINRSQTFHHSSALPINALYAPEEQQLVTAQPRSTVARPHHNAQRGWRVRSKPSATPYDPIVTSERRRAIKEQFKLSQQAQQVSAPQTPVSAASTTTSESPAIPQSVRPNYGRSANHTQMTHDYSQLLSHPQGLPNGPPAPTSNERLASGQPSSSSSSPEVTMHTGISFIRDYKTDWNNLHSPVHEGRSRAAEAASNINTYDARQSYSHSTATKSNGNVSSPSMNPPPAGTVFIYDVDSSTATLDPSQDYAEYASYFPLRTEEHRRLRVALHGVMTSQWKLQNELEPTPQHMLQFSQRSVNNDGNALYRCLFYHKGKACEKTWNRPERILAHLRKEIELRPFVCDGENDVCACKSRFFAEDTLQQHRKNVNTIPCTHCPAMVTPRNVQRHLKHNCPRSPDRIR